MRIGISFALACSILLVFCAQAQAERKVAAFAFGRGGDASKAAVEFQQALRDQIHTTEGHRNLDLNETLDASGRPRKAAIEEGVQLLKQGKAAYEELDLEEAQKSFDMALKKFEYGYGYLEEATPLTETLMYLGASHVLMGEDEEGSKFFMRAADQAGEKSLNPEVFPPNIQEIYRTALQDAESAAKGRVSLTSQPQGADIHVNGAFLGGTPLKVHSLRQGTHLLRAVKDGYRPWGGKLEIPSDKLKRFSFKLKPAAKHAAFSQHFRALTTEVFKGPPGTATQALASFLNVNLIFIVTMEGEAEGMQVVAYRVDVDAGMRVERFAESMDLTAADFNESRKAFLDKVLAGAAGIGAADAAAILAGEIPPSGQGADDTVADATAGQQGDATADVDAEQQRESELNAAIADDAKKGPEVKDEDAFDWAALPQKWWFWTAIGVVVVGAAVGTTVALLPGEDHSGSLVIGLH